MEINSQKTEQNQPIPMSRRVILDEFRRACLPRIIFTASVAAVAYLWTIKLPSKPTATQAPKPPLPALTNDWSVK